MMHEKNKRLGLVIKHRHAAWGGFFAFVLLLGVGVFQYSVLLQQSQALVSGQSGQVQIKQAGYRIYNPSSTTAPGTPLATDNTPATLAQAKSDFRVRVGVSSQSRAFMSVLTGGWNHTCGVDSYNRAYCWGEGQWGALGTGSTSNSITPALIDTSGVLSGKTIQQIVVGDWHTCALASDGRAYCWGYGSNQGELGNGTMTQANSPVAVTHTGVLAGKTITQITAGFNHNCVVTSDGGIYCWGEGLHGALGRGSTAISNVPVAVNMSGALAGKTIKYASAGYWHTCVLASDNKVYCWGDNSSGQLGNGSTAQANVPVAVNMSGALAGKTIKQIAHGGSNSFNCVIASDDKAYCWGGNSSGQLGNGSTTQANVPVAVNMSGALAGKTIKQITAGSDHACVIASDDKVYCWGRNASGELGNNSTTSSTTPVAVNAGGALAGKTIKGITAGGYRTCAVASDNQSYCWGSNDHGQFGNGSTTNSLVPTATGGAGTAISNNTLKLKAQYAEKTAATCSAVAAGWQDITNNSALAYSPSGPNSGAAIAAESDDPAQPTGSLGYSHQSVVRGAGNFTNNRAIPAGETGLWDLALTDLSLKRSTNYCVRLVTDTAAAPGTSIDVYSQYPEFKTSDGTLDIRFADAANTTLTNPTTSFTPSATSNAVATTTAQLSNNSSQQLEVSNTLSATGWNVTLAPTAGTGAKWEQSGGSANYGFNSTAAADGQLSVDLSAGAFAVSGTTPAGQACTTSGLSFGAGGAFVTGTPTAGAITLASASSASGLNCVFKLQNISLRQTIPAFQTPGTYSLPVTATVTAQ